MQLDRLDVRTERDVELREITDLVAERVAASGVSEGLCYVFSPHTTAGITINENSDSYLLWDMIYALDRAVPLRDPAYLHAVGNSAAHVKASMMGSSAVVPIIDGRLVLELWQGIYLCEFDGPRRRQALVAVVPAPGA